MLHLRPSALPTPPLPPLAPVARLPTPPSYVEMIESVDSLAWSMVSTLSPDRQNHVNRTVMNNSELTGAFFPVTGLTLTSLASFPFSFGLLPVAVIGAEPEDGATGFPFWAVLACVFGGLRIMALGKRGFEETDRGG